jgi:hypothetical protein
MAYIKGNCPECHNPVMTCNGVVMPHPLRGSIVPCDGAGVTIETESDASAAAPPAVSEPTAEVAVTPTKTPDEWSSPIEEIDMKDKPQKISIDLQQLEELAAEGLTQSVIAERLGLERKTLANKIYSNADTKAAWERGGARHRESLLKQESGNGAAAPVAAAKRKKAAGGARKASSKRAVKGKRVVAAPDSSSPEVSGTSAAKPFVANGDEAFKPHHRALRGALLELEFMVFHGEPSNRHQDVMSELYAAVGE